MIRFSRTVLTSFSLQAEMRLAVRSYVVEVIHCGIKG
jgi:hypothetical protein